MSLIILPEFNSKVLVPQTEIYENENRSSPMLSGTEKVIHSNHLTGHNIEAVTFHTFVFPHSRQSIDRNLFPNNRDIGSVTVRGT